MDRRLYSVSQMLLKWAAYFLQLEWDGTEEEKAAEWLKTLPHQKIVCPVCRGEGKHVNPSIDSQGLTAEDFDQDPDFREDYFSGRYDVQCVECEGRNVIDEINWERVNAEIRESWEEWQNDESSYYAMCAAEQRMGA